MIGTYLIRNSNRLDTLLNARVGGYDVISREGDKVQAGAELHVVNVSLDRFEDLDSYTLSPTI